LMAPAVTSSSRMRSSTCVFLRSPTSCTCTLRGQGGGVQRRAHALQHASTSGRHDPRGRSTRPRTHPKLK
jgi:hypothetical protein